MRGSSFLLGAVVIAGVLVPRPAWAELGRACATSAECVAGLTCMQANATSLDGEGPAKGYCTTSCAADDTICGQFDPSAVCVSYQNLQAYCFEGCTFGPAGLTQFDPGKCHGRQEVACKPFVDAAGTLVQPLCYPQCNSDADCGSGLYCNPQTGTCGSSVPTGKALGATCTQAGEGGVEECKGACIGFVHQSGQDPFTYMCAENCTLGAAASCGWAGPGIEPAPAACLFVSTIILDNGGAGIGDLGSCGQLCDCNSDCGNPDLVCMGWGPSGSQNEAFFQRAGYCSDPFQDDGGMHPGLCGTDAGTGGAGTGGAGTGATGTGATGGVGPDGGAFGGDPGFGGSANGDAGLPAGGGTSSGCGCRTASSAVSSMALAWSALLVLVGLGRRRVKKPARI